MVQPHRAVVRPRILTRDICGPMLLEDEVRDRIERKHFGLIELAGPPGSGKSTALAHLAHIFGDETRLILADCPDVHTELGLRGTSGVQIVIYVPAMASTAEAGIERWRLAPWTEDDCAEYLLGVHRTECADVMLRIKSDSYWQCLRGSPELCRWILDQFAQDKTLADVRSALRRELQLRLNTFSARKGAGAYCADVLAEVPMPGDSAANLVPSVPDPAVRALLRHEAVQLMLAAEYLVGILRTREASTILRSQPSDVLVREVAELLREDAGTLQRLEKLAIGRDPSCHAMAASLLNAANQGWMPDRQQGLLWMGAYLAGAHWPHLRLLDVDISHADLTGADLREAQLKDVSAREAQLNQACLSGASLDGFAATGATLDEVDLSFARVLGGQFQSASLCSANLEGARLPKADFESADLRGARFCRASLAYARFVACCWTARIFRGRICPSPN